MKKRRPTIAAGAVIERNLLYAFLRRLKEAFINKEEPRGLEAIGIIQKWLRAQPKRTARKGGIGR